jgi:gas vesicle protein
MRGRGIWIAFVVGVSAGAAVALLYAPESGVRTRRRLGKSIDQGADYLEDAAEYLKEQAENLSKQAQKTIQRTKSQLQEAVDVAADKASGAVKSIHSLM